MAAFLSGAVQAPMTAFVIIFEMTGHHEMLVPLMLSSLLAYMVCKLVGARHLYKTLAENYREPLSTSPQ
jgi:H+/Cl- antiporter ClcA